METTIAKPTTGVLYYGNQIVLINEPFIKLAAKQKELVAAGYNKKLFHKHYYYAQNIKHS